jgi:hypothetical protein
MKLSDRYITIAVTLLVIGTTVWAVPLWLGIWWGAGTVSTSPTPTPKPAPSGAASSSGTPVPVGTTSSSAWSTATYVRSYSGNSLNAPHLVAIRTAPHSADSYDRIALDFDQDSPPGYTIHYVDKVVRAASGQTVVMPGSAYLQLVFAQASAHDNNGNSTIINSPVQPVATQYNELWSYVLNGDFENQVSVALGLGSKSGYRVGEIRRDNGWTIYVDVLTQ